MKFFVILDLTDGGDGVSAHEFDSVEEAYAFHDEFDCPRWVAVEVLRPTKYAGDLAGLCPFCDMPFSEHDMECPRSFPEPKCPQCKTLMEFCCPQCSFGVTPSA